MAPSSVRLWISSLEDSAIREGFNHLRDSKEYDRLYEAALSRSKADWIVGINGTRLFTTLYHKKLVVGRVQTPTLAMLVERDGKISTFQKEKYFNVHVGKGDLTADLEKVKTEEEAKKIAAACEKKQAVVSSLKQETKTVNPPKLYDLTTLQREANRYYGFTAQQTLDLVQTLYEKKLLTYPRTDSQFITDDMEDTARQVISIVCRQLPLFSGVSVTPDIARVTDNTYTGNLLLQKTFRENHITKKTVINHGELPKYHAEDAHDAIISIETFHAVQTEKARRATQFNKKPAPRTTYPFTSLLVCDICGKNYRRKTTKTGIVWVCGTFNTLGKSVCASKQIPEATLQQVTAEVLGVKASYLSGQLTDTCGYIAYGDENAESTAQVILALCALGIDPETDSRFVKGEHTLLTELSQFREADGTYRHVLEGAGDGLATAQSVLALVAVQRVRSGQPWVLHFDGTQAPREAFGTNGIIICAVIGAVVVIAAGAIYIIGRKRKKA